MCYLSFVILHVDLPLCKPTFVYMYKPSSSVEPALWSQLCGASPVEPALGARKQQAQRYLNIAMQHAHYSPQHTILSICPVDHSIHTPQHAPYSPQHTPYRPQHAHYYPQHTTYSPTDCNTKISILHVHTKFKPWKSDSVTMTSVLIRMYWHVRSMYMFVALV